MDDVRCYVLGPPPGTIPAAVSINKNTKVSSFKSSEDIQQKDSGPDRSVNTFGVIIRSKVNWVNIPMHQKSWSDFRKASPSE